jgi:hypothetical protein
MERLRAPGAAEVVGATAADTVFAVDRVADDEIISWLDRNWPASEPLELVTEGLDDVVVIGRGDPRWTLIVDPIDGTRGLMYDKRPAWVLAAVAPRGGTLRDVVSAAMTEIPTSKQWASDQLHVSLGGSLHATRRDVRTGSSAVIGLRPSRATELDYGWASFARFFPPGKALIAAFEDTLWRELYGDDAIRTLPIFDDQYVSTGGQFYELLAGHDRMLGDVRPLAFAALGLDAALSAHPYDCCTALVLHAGGAVLTDPWGGPLDVPLDTTTPVAWVGFANEALAGRVRPALDAALARHFPAG